MSVARAVGVAGLAAYLIDRQGAVVELFEAAPGHGNEVRTSSAAADRPMGTG